MASPLYSPRNDLPGCGIAVSIPPRVAVMTIERFLGKSKDCAAEKTYVSVAPPLHFYGRRQRSRIALENFAREGRKW